MAIANFNLTHSWSYNNDPCPLSLFHFGQGKFKSRGLPCQPGSEMEAAMQEGLG